MTGPQTAADKEALFLFSSNMRPLYEQDTLNVLAAPSGLTCRFRYRRKYLSEELAERWGDGLQGLTCIAHFSLQQPLQYHDAVVFPIRSGIVTHATKEAGDVYLLEFAVARAISLERPSLPPTADSDAKARAYRGHVDDYRQFLLRRGVKVPYEAWASLGPDILDLGLSKDASVDVDGDEGVLFETTTQYLAGTSSYQNAVFYRVLGLERRDGGNSTGIPFVPGIGYRLQPSRAYHLVILHSQPHEEVTSVRAFTVTTDDAIGQIVGPHGFEVGSRYDVMSVPMIAAELPEARAREGVLEIAPDGQFQGPALTIPLRLEPERVKTTGAVVASIGGLILVGFTSLLASISLPLAVATLICGAIITTVIPLVMTGRTPWAG
jgi:hypothetical protein